MNLAVRGIDADIRWNNEGSFHKDELKDLRFVDRDKNLRSPSRAWSQGCFLPREFLQIFLDGGLFLRRSVLACRESFDLGAIGVGMQVKSLLEFVQSPLAPGFKAPGVRCESVV